MLWLSFIDRKAICVVKCDFLINTGINYITLYKRLNIFSFSKTNESLHLNNVEVHYKSTLKNIKVH